MTARAGTDDAPSKRQRVHIRIGYTGKGLPGPQLAQRCETLVRMLVHGDAGVIDERKVGDGTVDIYVITRFPDHTVELARRITGELGLTARTTIKIAPERAER